MKKIAVFPGSFDPVTVGHESLVLRALPLFDKIIIAIGENSTKNYLFPKEKRKRWIEETFSKHPEVEVIFYTGLTVDLCKKVEAKYIIRGLRSALDFEFESSIAKMNGMMVGYIETLFLLSKPEHSAINSTIVREIIKNGGDASIFVPKGLKLI